MAKSISGADIREGTTRVIGDNRYGMRKNMILQSKEKLLNTIAEAKT